MMTMRNAALVLLATLTLSAVLLASGCLVAAAGAAGGVFYAKGDKISSISIRVGTFGDEDLSQTIFTKIKKNL